jgi:hypothetical protein
MSSREFYLRILKWFCKPEYYPDIEGDLLELFERRAARMKEWRANLLLLRDVILLFRPGIIASENPFSTQKCNGYAIPQPCPFAEKFRALQEHVPD